MRTEDLVPGSVLAGDVNAEDGQVLLQKGAVMDKAIINLLMKRGIATVCVETESVKAKQSAAALRLECRDRRRTFLERIFEKVPKDKTLMWKIYMEAASRAGVSRFWEDDDEK